MKNVLIVVIGALALGFLGFAGTMETAIWWQNHQDQKPTVPSTSNERNQMMALQKANAAVDRALRDAEDRQGYAMIGGSIGCAVGLLGSIGLVTFLGRRKMARILGNASDG